MFNRFGCVRTATKCRLQRTPTLLACCRVAKENECNAICVQVVARYVRMRVLGATNKEIKAERQVAERQAKVRKSKSKNMKICALAKLGIYVVRTEVRGRVCGTACEKAGIRQVKVGKSASHLPQGMHIYTCIWCNAVHRHN